MKNKLYLECTSGISGDMTVAALLDLGADREKLERALKSLPVKGFDIKISRVVKSGIDACDFDVLLDQEHENHDHDMEYLHGHHGNSHGHEIVMKDIIMNMVMTPWMCMSIPIFMNIVCRKLM